MRKGGAGPAGDPGAPGRRMMKAFIKFMRDDADGEIGRLMRRTPWAFLLLAWIAIRANRTNEPNLQGLLPGEAFLGDWEQMGFPSEKIYRNAKDILRNKKLATFRNRGIGTVVRIETTEIFDINEEKTGAERTVAVGRKEPSQQGGKNRRSGEDITSCKSDSSDVSDVSEGGGRAERTVAAGREKGGGRATNKNIRTQEGKKEERECESGNADPEPMIRTDEVHEILMGAEGMRRLTWEADKLARRNWPGLTADQVLEAARRCAAMADCQSGAIGNAMSFWNARLSEADLESKPDSEKKQKPRLVFGRQMTAEEEVDDLNRSLFEALCTGRKAARN